MERYKFIEISEMFWKMAAGAKYHTKRSDGTKNSMMDLATHKTFLRNEIAWGHKADPYLMSFSTKNRQPFSLLGK